MRNHLFVAALFCTCVSGQDRAVKQFSVVVDKPEAEYSIDVGGTVDPENVEITIENLSDSAVVNPRITVNGLYDWYDAKSLAAEITRDCHTDEEKALAIWWWVRYRTYQLSPHDDSATHPVRALNGYGYGICGHVAAWMKCLWAAAGVKGRVDELWGHTISEAWYNNAWHLLDGNVKVFYLDRDNRTIASLATLEHDKWLIERAVHPREREPWYLGPDPPGRNEQFVHYIVSFKDNYEDRSYDYEIFKDYSMAMTLKPGEKLVRWWTPKLGKFEGSNVRPTIPLEYANGQLIWEPDLSRVDIKPYLSFREHRSNVTTRAQDGREPAIHVDELQDEMYDQPAVFSIPISSPYPIVGGRFSCTLVKEGDSGLDSASMSFGPHGWESGDLYVYRWGKGPEHVSVDLDAKLGGEATRYNYSVGFAISGNGTRHPATQTGVDAFHSETDLQVSPESLPALALGKNTIRFRQQSSGKVRITHTWKEVAGHHPPGRVVKAIETDRVSLTPTLKWSAPADADPASKPVDYQVMVCLRSDCRWPLSTTLHRNVGSDKPEWKVPASFLNPETQYYWKVRARNAAGDVGEWGNVFSFKTAADAR